MESTNELEITTRSDDLKMWLQANLGKQFISMSPMPGDASFRRYYRIMTTLGSFVAMDAPSPEEKCPAFIAIANSLRALQLHAPEIISADLAQGFLLLTDFGDQTFLSALTKQNADQLYRQALGALAVLQSCREVKDWEVPSFTYSFMQQEWSWHKEWFLDKWLGLSFANEEKILDQCFHLIAESAANQPQVFMHRDYHSANLMLTPNGEVGILDFQDAFIGPVTYDLVSILRDCYIDWPNEKVNQWVKQYLHLLQTSGNLQNFDEETFLRWFDWMSVERHLKAMFTFARKHVRDHQSQYLKHVPRTLHYVLSVSARYPELKPLHQLMSEKVKPAVEERL